MSINSLPPEILTYIFHLVISPRPCFATGFETQARLLSLPPYPGLLSHVCSYWRQQVIGTTTLWDHIDIIPLNKHNNVLESRALDIGRRYSSQPLEVCMGMSHGSHQCNLDHLVTLLDLAATRIRALSCHVGWQPHPQHRGTPDPLEILDNFFGRCVPNTLTTLAVTNSPDMPVLLVPTNNPCDTASAGSEIVHLRTKWDVAEALLLPIRVIKLSNAFFAWESGVYRNLVELCLHSNVGNRWPLPRLTDLDLVSILTSSPGLCVFHFGLKLELLSEIYIPPVDLPRLDTLCFPLVPPGETGTIIRLIAPGPLPLRLYLATCEHHGQSVPFHDEHVLNFFARANIVKLCVEKLPALNSVTQVTENVRQIVEPLPQLRELTLISFGHTSQDRNREVESSKSNDHHSGPRLDALYVFESYVSLSELRHMIQRYTVKAIFIWGCIVRDGQRSLRGSELERALSDICPAVQVPRYLSGLMLDKWW